jgi:malonate-semialdehyde dehydrogenase (acetylating)/methylmalonate-semialdehyde dehydrogenase
VIDYIDQGVESGATLLLDGRQHPMTSNSEGFFLGPTLFDHVQKDMSIYLDEIFGPVLVMLRVKNFSEAIELANQHQFGNGVALFTTKGSAAREFVNSVQVGMVGINVAIPVPLSFYTFGGWKDSMYGSSNIYGMDGVRFYTRTKTVTTRWPDIDDDEDLNLSMPTVK